MINYIVKKIVLFLFFLVSTSFFAQNIVQWEGTFSKETSEIILTAKIEKDWHLYSQHISLNAGPIPTKINFKKNKNVKIKGKLIEENVHAIYDENYEAHIAVFNDKAIFKQKVKAKRNTEVIVNLTYMVCDNTRCVPKDESLIIKIEK